MQLRKIITLVVVLFHLSGCSVITVADAAVSTVATGVKVTAKVAGAVIGAVIPDCEEDEQEQVNEEKN